MIDYVLPDFSTIKKGFCKVIWKILIFLQVTTSVRFEKHPAGISGVLTELLIGCLPGGHFSSYKCIND